MDLALYHAAPDAAVRRAGVPPHPAGSRYLLQPDVLSRIGRTRPRLAISPGLGYDAWVAVSCAGHGLSGDRVAKSAESRGLDSRHDAPALLRGVRSDRVPSASGSATQRRRVTPWPAPGFRRTLAALSPASFRPAPRARRARCWHVPLAAVGYGITTLLDASSAGHRHRPRGRTRRHHGPVDGVEHARPLDRSGRHRLSRQRAARHRAGPGAGRRRRHHRAPVGLPRPAGYVRQRGSDPDDLRQAVQGSPKTSITTGCWSPLRRARRSGRASPPGSKNASADGCPAARLQRRHRGRRAAALRLVPRHPRRRGHRARPSHLPCGLSRPQRSCGIP